MVVWHQALAMALVMVVWHQVLVMTLVMVLALVQEGKTQLSFQRMGNNLWNWLKNNMNNLWSPSKMAKSLWRYLTMSAALRRRLPEDGEQPLELVEEQYEQPL